MRSDYSMEKIWALLLLPKRWIVNLIRVQEKKEYNFYVVLLFACFVCLVRYTLEFMLSYKFLYLLNPIMIATLTFYLQCIFIYTFILWIFIPKFEWKKSIHLVLIGVFLGVFPPLIDTITYGAGNFNYGYVPDYKVDWNFLIFNKEASIPFGEAATLFTTMFLVATVVWIKTNSIFRTTGAFLLTYSSVFFYGGLLPLYADKLTQWIQESAVQSSSVYISAGNLQKAVELPMLGYLQIAICVVIYLVLNPHIGVNLVKRLNHALPVVLTTLLGYSLYKSIDGFGFLIAFIMFFAAMVVVIQNDYFDRDEDILQGRTPYLTRDDLAFFNVMLILMIALLVANAQFAGYMVMLFLVASYLYNYDYYRGKKYFPSNYKLEGIAGLAAVLAGISMVISSAYQISGDFLNAKDTLGKSPLMRPMGDVLREIWSTGHLWIVFFVFGGWSIVSVLKDYKDIENDSNVGTQSIYALLTKRGKNVEKFHKVYVCLLSILMLIPSVWLAKINAPAPHFILLVFLCAALLFATKIKSKKRSVSVSLYVINFYLLNLVIAFHSNHLTSLS